MLVHLHSAQIAKSSEEIEHLKQVVTQLQASNANRSGGPDNNLNDDEMIPRPKTPFNIELEMGLVEDHARYLSVAVCVLTFKILPILTCS